jgi:hypothetical protein
MTDLDISCLIDVVEPSERNVKVILQLLLENQCTLKELIDDIETGSTDVTLNLNLKCLKKYDEFENEIPQDLNQTLQSIVNQVCTSKDDIANIKNDILELQDAIDDIDTDPYTEPSITVCTVSGSRPVSEAVPLVANDLCTFKTKVGSASQISTAVGRQCEDAATDYSSTLGWITSPAALAETVNNQWIIICDLMSRIKVMETTCCAPACDKIKLGYVPELDYDAKTLTLSWESGAGTSIPSNFEDCGTVLTITDDTGYEKTYTNLAIEQGGTTGPLNLTGLDYGKLQLNFKTKFCLKDASDTTIMVCQDCVNEELNYFNDNCCTISNFTTGPVTIVYETCATQSN